VGAAGVDLEVVTRPGLDPRAHAVGGVGVEVGEAAEGRAFLRLDRGLRMMLEQVVSPGAEIGEGAQAVEVAHAAAPVHEVDEVLDHVPRVLSGGDLARPPRNPGVPQVPHQDPAAGAARPVLPELPGHLPDRRRHPGAAYRGRQTRSGVREAGQVGVAGSSPPGLPAGRSSWFVPSRPPRVAGRLGGDDSVTAASPPGLLAGWSSWFDGAIYAAQARSEVSTSAALFWPFCRSFVISWSVRA